MVSDGFLFYALIFLTMKLTHGQSGYYNPSITFSLALTDIYLDPQGWRRHLIRLGTYACAQFLGAILGTPHTPQRTACTPPRA